MTQHRLARVQVVNWGTFDGEWSFSVPWKGMLLTGPSGAGKSSLLDAMAALLVRRPADFDVLVTENLFGDVLSDLAGELAGSLGIAGSVNSSESRVMAQASHGAAPDIAGRGIANPVAMIASVAMGFQRYGQMTDDAALVAAGARIDSAVAETLAHTATRDLGGEVTTAEFADAVVRRIVEG